VSNIAIGELAVKKMLSNAVIVSMVLAGVLFTAPIIAAILNVLHGILMK